MVDASFPDDLHTWTDVVDNEDIISGVHMNIAHAEIIAIENFLFKLNRVVKVYRSGSTQTCNAGAITKIQFNAADYDPETDFDITTDYEYTAPFDGFFLFSGTLRFIGLAKDTTYSIIAYLNGSTHQRCAFNYASATNYELAFTVIVKAEEGDAIDIRFNNTGGGNEPLDHEIDDTMMTIKPFALL